MKKIIGWLRLSLVTAVVLIGAMGTAATMPRVASGTTAQKFVIDTRDKKFCIVDVKGDYCWGKYHSADGHGATFLNGVGLDLGFKIKADRGTGGKLIDHYEYGSRTTKTDEFRVDVGALAPGTKLEVVAVATDGTRSEPFRVNFDIASAPEKSDAFHVAKKHVGVSVVYEAENLSTFDLLDDVNGFLKFFDNASDVRVLPSFSADVLVDSASGEYSRAVGAGVRVDPFANNEKMLKKMAKKIGKLAGADLDAVLIGGPTSKWNPYAQEWQEESTSVGVLLGCHVHMIKGRVPESLGIVHYAFGLEGEGEFTGTWLKDKKLNFTAAFDPLLGVTACLGAGAKILADVEGYAKGGVFLTAQGPNKPHLKELGFRGGFGWDAHMFGFKVKDGYIDWTQYLVGGPPKPAAQLMKAMSVSGFNNYANAQPISRNYLNAPKKARLMAAGNGTGADDERVVVENGYQWPDPTVAACGTRHVLAYLVDDPARNDINRTKLVCSVDDGTAETVWDDGTPDFKPSVGMAADGTVVLAWMNGKSAYSATATAPTVFAGSELAVAVRNVATEQWTRKNLTNDAVLDRAPLVRVTPDGKACVLWVRNAACDPFGSPTAKNEMWGAVYNGTTWGAPTKLFEMNAIGGFDFHYGRESGALAATFALAELNGTEASVLQRISYGRWNGGAGAVTPQLYREIDLESASPYVCADKDGSLKLLWGEAGGIRTRTFATGGTGLVSGDERIYAFDGDSCGAFALAKGADGRLAAIGSQPNARFPWTSDPAVCHYDTNADVWSGAVALLDNDWVERSLDAVLDGSGNLIAAYASVTATKADDGTLTYGAVDVRTLTRRAGVDLAVMAEDITFAEDSDFSSGGTAPVVVKLLNLGNAPALGVPVRVLVGQDEESLAVVSDSALTVDFAAGGVTNVTADWIVNLNVSNLIVRVEIDPDETVNDIDRGNNAATREAVASLRVANTRARSDAVAKTCTLTATVFNGGFKAVPAGTVVTFEREDGTEIGRDEIGRVMPGENGLYEASVVWNLAGVSFAKSDETVTIRLTPPPGFDMAESPEWTSSCRVLTGFAEDVPEPPTPADGTYTTTIDGIEWTYTIENGMATLRGITDGEGTRAVIPTNTTGRVVIPSSFGGCALRKICYNAFWHCERITSVEIPDCVRNLETQSFFRCDSLERVEIPEGVTRIYLSAFYNCKRLSSVVIPKSVTFMGNDRDGNPFDACPKLEVIEVRPGNEKYKVVDGMVLTADGKTLISVPSAWTTVVVPAGVEELARNAVNGNTELCSLTLPESLRRITDGLGWGCMNLERLVIPAAVAELGENAFGNLGVKTVVDFMGAPPGGTDAVSSHALTATYASPFVAEWENVIESDGTWRGLSMKRGDGEPLEIYDDLDQAKNAAIREGKLVFLVSGANWCPYTTKLKQYVEDAGSTFTDNYVYLWHDQDKDPFGIAEMSSVPEFWIFQPSDLDLSTKSSWDTIALFNCPGCPTDYAYFLRVLESVAESKPANAMPLSLAGVGWHEVSFSVLPEGGKPEDVFAPVAGKIGYVTYGSKNWSPAGGGTLTALEIGKGYWVQTTAENVAWTVTGQGNPGVEIVLKPGWNLIGYPLLEEGEVETVLATALATGNIRYISSGSRVYPGTLKTMAPGKGYWVYAEAAATIKFDFNK